jgi:predicted DNA-binding transcriptional regulator YafY
MFQDFFDDRARIDQGDDLHFVLFEPKRVVYITERQWHPTQDFRLRAEGRVTMRLETTGRKELIRWVLSWMPDGKVLAPESLQGRIVEKLQDRLRAPA